LTKPVPDGDATTGTFLADEAAVAFALGGARGVMVLSDCCAFLSGVFLTDKFGADVSAGLFGPLLAAGGSPGLAAGLFAGAAVRGFGGGFVVRVADLELSFSTFSPSFPPLDPFVAPASRRGAAAFVEDDSFTADLLVTCLFDSASLAVDVPALATCVSSLDRAASLLPESGRGDSGIG
jgi:hypothetical protein